ncbi:MAG: hypothetical protein KJP02_09315, partial [Octadecabacter sp.]|nr:hypothetical protein [Octadecabacter sp.]
PQDSSIGAAAELIDKIATLDDIERADWTERLRERLKKGTSRATLPNIVSKKATAHRKEQKKEQKTKAAVLELDPDTFYLKTPNDSQQMYDDLCAMLIERNKQDPKLFKDASGKNLTTIVDSDPVYARSLMRPDEFSAYLADCKIRMLRLNGEGETVGNDRVDRGTVSDTMGSPALIRNLPSLSTVSNFPIYASNGTLRTEKGYDADSGTFFAPSIEYRDVPETPEAGHVGDALGILFYDALRDLPFSDEVGDVDVLSIYTRAKDDDGFRYPNMERGMSSRMNALAMMLTPIVRNMIHGPIPLGHVDKPVAGTGASVLLQLIHMTIVGKPFPIMHFPTTTEEFNKQMLGQILAGKQIIAYDNIDHNARLDDPFFAGIITSGRFEGRILGVNDIGEGEVRALFMTTGNNIRSSKEILRRIAPIYLNTQMQNPQNRKNIKHPDVITWVTENRAELAWACHILIQNWIAKGCPRYTNNAIGSFEAWSGVIGGILEATEMLDMDAWQTIHYRYFQEKGDEELREEDVMEWIVDEFEEVDYAFAPLKFRQRMWPGDLAGAQEVEPSVSGAELDGRGTLAQQTRRFLNQFVNQTYNLKDGRRASLIYSSGKRQYEVRFLEATT